MSWPIFWRSIACGWYYFAIAIDAVLCLSWSRLALVGYVGASIAAGAADQSYWPGSVEGGSGAAASRRPTINICKASVVAPGRGVRPVAIAISADRSVPARPGEPVQLTIDMELQLAAEAALSNWAELADELGTLSYDSPKMQSALRVGKGRAGLAMMDLRTGGLLALASTPQFDLRSIRDDWAAAGRPTAAPGTTIERLRRRSLGVAGLDGEAAGRLGRFACQGAGTGSDD